MIEKFINKGNEEVSSSDVTQIRGSNRCRPEGKVKSCGVSKLYCNTYLREEEKCKYVYIEKVILECVNSLNE